MKSNTIASEKTPIFYVKLKKSAIDSWYLPDLKMRPLAKYKIPKELTKREFRIDSIAFFKKHVWYHFVVTNTNQDCGWIRYKFLRRNYCRLDVAPIKQNDNRNSFNSDLISVMMMFHYYGNHVTFNRLIQMIDHPVGEHLRPNDLFSAFVSTTGSFENLTKKTFRRIAHQLLRCHPVIMWVLSFDGKSECPILLVGFNRRIFFYNDPKTGKLRLISRNYLNRLWKKTGSFAISY